VDLDFLSFLDSLPSSTSTKSYTNDFWDALQSANGANTMGNIILVGDFTDQLKSAGNNNKGLKYAGATKNLGGEGYTVTCQNESFTGSVPIYWLPWLKNETVYAERAWFEKSKCEYFVTSALSGCRFVLTPQHVIHIAAEVCHAGGKDGAQNEITKGDPRARKMSVSINASNEQGYGNYRERTERGLGLVFGMRRDGIWTYKALKYTLGSTGGTWETMICGAG